MDFLPDPAEMTAEERFLQLAAILARGYLRLRKAGFLPGIAPNDGQCRLDSRGEPTPPLDAGRGPGANVGREVQG
jgi:hypothetical protein